MTIVSALKKLHKKMTGKDATGMTVANVVNSLSDNYTGGGGEGGDTTYWVDFAYGTPITTTTTCADVVQAAADDKTVLGRIDLGTQTLTFVCTSARADKCVFVGSINERDVYVLVIVDENGVPVVSKDEKAFVPVGTADGQTLVWDVDRWLAVSNPNAPYIVHMEIDLGAGTASVTDGKTIADILAVAASNPNVYAEFAFGTGYGRLPLVGWDSDTATEESTVTFSGVSAGAKGLLIEGENDGTTETWAITPES